MQADDVEDLTAEQREAATAAAVSRGKPFYWGVVQMTNKVDGRDVLTVVMQRPLPKRAPSTDPSAAMRFGSAGMELESRDWRLLPGPSIGSFTRYAFRLTSLAPWRTA